MAAPGGTQCCRPPHEDSRARRLHRGSAITTTRPASDIRLDLGLALAYRERHKDRPANRSLGPVDARRQRARDILELQTELAEAMSGDLEVSLSGTPVQDHTVTVPYISRVLDALQASFRTITKSLSPEPTHRSETTLSISGTAPGSFKVALKTPTIQLDLIEDPLMIAHGGHYRPARRIS